MKINAEKLARQEVVIDNFRKHNGVGILEACTGFGKTFVAILLILKLNKKLPNESIIVVVPKVNLKDEWEKPGGHIDKHKLKNVNVFVLNTYVASQWECKFLIVDEVHHVLSEDAIEFKKVLHITKFNYFLGLSATLNDKEKAYLFKLGIKIIDTISVHEGESKGYITKSHVYNLSIDLAEDQKEAMSSLDKTINYNFSRFNNNFTLVYACAGGKDNNTSATINDKKYFGTCAEFRMGIAKKMGWDGIDNHPWSPSNIQKSAILFTRGVRERKEVLYGGENKLNMVISLLDKFSNKKVIVFWQTTEMAKKLESKLGKDKCRAYYSNMTSEYYVDGVLIAKAEKVKNKKKVKTLYRLINDKTSLLEYSSLREKYPKGKRKSGAAIQKEALNIFKSKQNNVNVFSVVTAVDEGLDDQSVDFVIAAAYFASRRQDIQRRGRGSRINPEEVNKKTLVVNLFYKDTQEAKWLRKKQKGAKSIKWVNSVDEINDPATFEEPAIILATKDEK